MAAHQHHTVFISRVVSGCGAAWLLLPTLRSQCCDLGYQQLCECELRSGFPTAQELPLSGFDQKPWTHKPQKVLLRILRILFWPLPCQVLCVPSWIRCCEMTPGCLPLLCDRLNQVRYQFGRSNSKDPRCGRIRVTQRLGRHLDGRLNWRIKIRWNHEVRNQMIGSRHVHHSSTASSTTINLECNISWVRECRRESTRQFEEWMELEWWRISRICHPGNHGPRSNPEAGLSGTRCPPKTLTA